ncbi:MAG: RNA methyltransferase, partial [Oscillibacter sp.]|nr:RNA methyltransferase [Oscillibacter sp.]
CGADGAILTGECADPYHPKTIRATMGAIFRLPVFRASAEELAALLNASDIPLYGAALREDTEDARNVDYTRCAVAIGSEGRGLTEEILAKCDRTIRIPMRERCESLNAAVAAAVLLWEAARGER